MTVCRHVRRRAVPLLAAVLAVVAVAVVARGGKAAESPIGKTVSDVVPLENRLRPKEQILGVMQTRPGRPYDEGVIQEDVRRLHATKWFTPGGVQVYTTPDGDGRVLVWVKLTEVTNTVQAVVYDGAEHLKDKELDTLVGVRKGDPMNPYVNEQGRAAILRKYQEDGRYYASVRLVEGGRQGDSRVVYDITEGPVVKVVGVEFRGLRGASPGRLKEQLVTKRAFLGSIGGRYNPMTVDADRQKLAEYYHGLGYLQVQVTPEIVHTDDPRKIVIVYYVDEGAQHRVNAIDVTGAKSIGSPELVSLTEQKAGDRYDRRVTEADRKRIADKFGYNGKAVAVEERVYEVAGQPGVVNVHYEVVNDTGGQPDRVGRVIIEGNEVTKDRVILNQLDLRPGQVLQYPLLEDARGRLARLGLFDPENPPEVEAVQTEYDSLFKDVRVRVKETRTGQFQIGAGVNSNSGVNGQIVINERNFDLFRFPTSWDDLRDGRAFRGAGQEFKIEAVPASTFQRYTATFREPYLFDSRFGFTNSIYYYGRNYAEFDETRVGMRTTIDRRLDPIWRTSFTTRIEDVGVKNVPPYATRAITDDAGHSTLIGLRAGLTRDSRNSYLYPTGGSVVDLGFEQVLGDYQFPIGTAEVSKFFSSEYLQREDGSGKHILALRSGVQVEGGNAPVFERFYAGGFRSLRGFSFAGVGPRENGLNVRGTFSFLNTIEYQVPVLPSDKLFFVTFLDHGTVESKVQIKDYRVAAGFGVRIAVPALGPMPLAFDFAFPITKAPGDDRQIFSFYMGLFGGPN